MNRKRLRIGVVGAGTMGRGVVQLFAQAGHDVLCFDEKAGAAATGIAAVVDALEKLAAKGRLSAADLADIRSRTSICRSLSDLAQCDVVVEAVIEDLAVKRALFAKSRTDRVAAGDPRDQHLLARRRRDRVRVSRIRSASRDFISSIPCR